MNTDLSILKYIHVMYVMTLKYNFDRYNVGITDVCMYIYMYLNTWAWEMNKFVF